jgi:hypothetical protein
MSAHGLRHVAVVFWVYLTVIVAGLAVFLVIGFSHPDSSERHARATVERFFTALEQHDGRRACAQLTEDAASAVEQQERRPCNDAILSLEIEPGEPGGVDIEVNSGKVALPHGQAVFLDETAQGWRISAAGCKPATGGPYECELEA